MFRTMMIFALMTAFFMVATTPLYALTAPTDVRATITSAGARLSWSAVENASGYRIYRAKADVKDTFGKIGQSSGTSWTDNRAQTGRSYMYYLVAYSSNSVSDKSEIVMVEMEKTATSSSSSSNTSSYSSDNDYAVCFEAYRDKNTTVNECAVIKYKDNSVWISRADNQTPKYPPMVSQGHLPDFPGEPKKSVVGFGINSNYRFSFFWEIGSSAKTVFISSSKFISSWTEWASIGELNPPAGYRPGKFKFAFAVSPTYFCCVALNTSDMTTYEATCPAGGKNWSPWKSTGRSGEPRFIKGDSHFALAYDDKIYYGVLMQPKTNSMVYNTFNGASWMGWEDAPQKPVMPEWMLRD